MYEAPRGWRPQKYLYGVSPPQLAANDCPATLPDDNSPAYQEGGLQLILRSLLRSSSLSEAAKDNGGMIRNSLNAPHM